MSQPARHAALCIAGAWGDAVVPNFDREITLTRFLIGFTLIASAFLALDVFGILAQQIREADAWRTFEQGSFIAIVYFLIYGNLVYQLARLGYLVRRRRYEPVSTDELQRFHPDAPSLTVLVPSYREEIAVVRRTLLSAALQDYPNKCVVLLIDDPPQPADAAARRGLQEARSLPGEVRALVEKPALRVRAALSDLLERRGSGTSDAGEEAARLAEVHAELAVWFESQATSHEADHADRWFAEFVLRRCARLHTERCLALEADPEPDVDALEREHRRLVARFAVEITSFERKRFVNLSHEANKAMNLNSYIALLGRGFCEVGQGDGLHLEPCAKAGAPVQVAAAEVLITLDADSILAPDYALRLAHILSRPGNERLAVVQTPYSAFPAASNVLERVAGATTDMQYIVHQGSTHWDATYWVGANAMLRKSALDDLCVVGRERGYEVARFIQDRTVIEDTESSVDLIDRGWRLHNHPERLAFSATPPDFGALAIQRERWANGGLLILGGLLRHLARAPRSLRKLSEGFFRGHYLASIAGVNLGLLALLAYPFEAPARTAWIVLAALPYYFLYGRDLVQMGYSAGDLLRVYALNLMLLPVNLGGVFRSIRQGLTRRKSRFARTPKVDRRTLAHPAYLLAQYALIAMMAVNLVGDLFHARWLHATFVIVNGGMLLYALVRFIGFHESLADLRVQLRADHSRGLGSEAGGTAR